MPVARELTADSVLPGELLARAGSSTHLGVTTPPTHKDRKLAVAFLKAYA
jgi:hypothetical protein